MNLLCERPAEDHYQGAEQGVATNRLPAASRNRYANSTINFEYGGRSQAACGRTLTFGKESIMQKFKTLSLAGLLLCAPGCAMMDSALSGETLARFENATLEHAIKVISIQEPKELRMWAEVDVLYQPRWHEREEGAAMDTWYTARIDYQVQVFHKGSLVYSCSDDALWHNDAGKARSYQFVMNSNKGGKQRTRYQKRLFECTFTPSEAGDYRFKVSRKLIGKFFEVNKCNLLIKSR